MYSIIIFKVWVDGSKFNIRDKIISVVYSVNELSSFPRVVFEHIIDDNVNFNS